MSGRAQLLLRCSVEDAREVRRRAEMEFRTISAYVLRTVLRAAEVERSITAAFPEHRRIVWRKQLHAKGKPRTTMLLRCSRGQAEQVRAAARRRQTSISDYVFLALRRSWRVGDELSKKGPRATL
jgi:uncharacterized protein (DUF1778 family)